MLLTLFLRSLVGLIWLISLVIATVLVLPVLAGLGGWFLVRKLMVYLGIAAPRNPSKPVELVEFF